MGGPRPLLLALAAARGPGHGFRLGYVTGAVSSLGIVYWTSRVVVQYGGLSEPVGVAVMLLLCLALALFPSLFGAVVAGWTRAFGPSGLLAAPVAWVAMDCSGPTRCSTSPGASSATASTRSRG